MTISLQKGDHENRTLNQMAQHFSEVSAFFKSHQSHVKQDAGPEAKLVEASKYGLRLVSNIQTTASRARAFNVAPPNIDMPKVATFATLMTSLNAIRGTGKPDAEVLQLTQHAVAVYTGQAAVQDMEKTLEEINGFVDEMSAIMDIWVDSEAVAELRDRYV